MKERAYAKINLCLDVKGRRDDGYHELEMIMVPITFYDVLEMVPAEESVLQVNRSYLPVNEKNTIIKAIRVMQEEFGFDQNFACRLQKHIPTRAGLAGGSADAAAAIRMMNRMMGLQLTIPEMAEIGKKVGADVPFCVMNRPAMVAGIGEILTPFSVNVDFDILLVKPRSGVSTKTAFEMIDSGGGEHPDCIKMRDSLITGDYEGVVSSLGNTLEAASLQLVSDIRLIKELLTQKGFDGVLMSGSGSTVFGITRNPALCDQVMEEMKSRKYFVRKTKILR